MKLSAPLILLLSLAFLGCSDSSPARPAATSGITLTFTGPLAVSAGTQVQYTSAVFGTSNQAVIWQVNGVTGGSAATGTISVAGLYTAPAVVPSPATVSVTVVSAADATASTTEPVALSYAVPIISTATGSTTTYGQTFLIDVVGTGFTSGANLSVNGTALTTQTIGANELQATYANHTGASLQASVLVQNPLPGGGVSPAVSVALNIPAPPTTQNQWMTTVSQQNVSPAYAAAGDAAISWAAPDGRTIQLVVKQPAPAANAQTVTLPSVPAGADARSYFDTAITQARTAGAGRLLIPTGTYLFKTVESDGGGHLDLEGLKDITIDGQGSTFIFTQPYVNGVFISTSQRLKLTNVSIQWQLPQPLTFVGTVSTTTPYTLTANAGYTITSADTVGHLAQYDPAGQNFTLNGNALYGATYQYNGNGGLTSSAFNSAFAGRSYMVFEQTYGGTAIEIEDTTGPLQAEDITVDTVTINSGPGMGIIAYGLKRGLGVWNTKIVPTAGALTSTEYDGMHMLIAGGDVYLHDNVISSQGDDAINLNNPVMPVVTYAGGTTLELSTYSRFIQQYDLLSFFDKTNAFLGTAQVTSVPSSQGGPNNQYYSMNLSNAITGTPFVVRDMNLVDSRVAVVDNTIENCQCHGMLVQSPNTLVKGNTFTHTGGDAIRLLTNVGTFQEGTGAINVLVQNNNINTLGAPADIPADTTNYAGIFAYNATSSGIASTISNQYIDIVGNTIANASADCVIVASSQYVNVTGNTCASDNLNTFGQPSIYIQNSNTVTIQQNSRSGSTTGTILAAPGSTSAIVIQSPY